MGSCAESGFNSTMPVCGDEATGPSVEFLSTLLPLSIDCPAGRIEGALSAVTGKPLRYFVPDPLPELLDRCKIPPRRREEFSDPHLAFVLARAASRRGLGGEVDAAHALRFCELIAGRKAYKNTAQLMELGRQLCTRNTGLREEIIFSGAPTASEAKNIFAPYSMLPALMDSLVQALDLDQGDMDPSAVSAITGFYGVCAHPFLDGNGRWARLVAASAGMSFGAAMPVMINIVFQNACKSELADEVWPSARAYGLRNYLDAAWRFEEELLHQVNRTGLLTTVTRLNAELRQSAHSLRDFHTIAFAIYSNQEIQLTRLRSLFGMSARAFSGFTARISAVHDRSVSPERNTFSIQSLLSDFDQAVANARQATFERNSHNA